MNSMRYRGAIGILLHNNSNSNYSNSKSACARTIANVFEMSSRTQSRSCLVPPRQLARQTRERGQREEARVRQQLQQLQHWDKPLKDNNEIQKSKNLLSRYQVGQWRQVSANRYPPSLSLCNMWPKNN